MLQVEELFHKSADGTFESGTLVFRGYIDDPRNTDNAWTESTAFHFHCSGELGAQLPLSAGDDAADLIWLDVDMEDERYKHFYGDHRWLVDRVSSSMQDAWTASAWLTSVGVVKTVANVLMGGAKPTDELAAVRALGAAATSEEALAEHLSTGGVAEALAKLLLPKLRQLSAVGAAHQLHGKFVQDGNAFKMTYADLSTFFGGLEAKIGAPNPSVETAMAGEHTQSADSKEEFTTGNYGVTTTPEIEWLFVVEPQQREGGEHSSPWPKEEKLCDTPKRMRSPMPLDEMKKKLAEVNHQLKDMNEPPLEFVEGFGARLYTGPM
jgi:hypothetical protein